MLRTHRSIVHRRCSIYLRASCTPPRLRQVCSRYHSCSPILPPTKPAAAVAAAAMSISSRNVAPPEDWWEEFIRANPVPQESLDHFRKIDWTSQYLSNPVYEPVPVFSRILKDNGEDYYFSKTLCTEDTIPHYIGLMRKNIQTPDILHPSSPEKDSQPSKGSKPPATPPENLDCVFLLSIGKRGTDGHPGVMHGGVSCAILDETIGFMVLKHVHNIEGPIRKSYAYTVNLNTTYRAPVPTPGELVIKTWLTMKEGRKWAAIGQILDKNGTVCTEAECLYVLVPNQRL